MLGDVIQCLLLSEFQLKHLKGCAFRKRLIRSLSFNGGEVATASVDDYLTGNYMGGEMLKELC